MSAAAKSDASSISCLFNLEVRALNGVQPTRDELVESVRLDISRKLPISKVVFFKYFTGNQILSSDDLRELICLLTDGVATALSKAPEAARSYSNAAIVCQTELLVRR